jgi:hypothetical protein
LHEIKEGTPVVSKLAEGLGRIEADSEVCEDIHSNEQWAVTRQGIMMMRACREEILEEKKRYFSLQTAALDIRRSASGTCALPPVSLDIADHYQDDLPQVNRKCLLFT